MRPAVRGIESERRWRTGARGPARTIRGSRLTALRAVALQIERTLEIEDFLLQVVSGQLERALEVIAVELGDVDLALGFDGAVPHRDEPVDRAALAADRVLARATLDGVVGGRNEVNVEVFACGILAVAVDRERRHLAHHLLLVVGHPVAAPANT